MSRYVRGSGLTWAEYLQAESFVNDIRWEISDSAAKVLGSMDAIASDNGARIEAGFEQLSGDLDTVNESLGDINESLGGIDDTLKSGFVTLHFDLADVRQSLVDLGAKFEWGFSELAMQLGSIGDTLSELLRVAKTPEQTWAYEQFDIARDAYRKRLYDDAIDYAQRAIVGFQSHTGYRLDHRSHHLLGLIYLGDRKSASSGVVNPETAEKHLLDAARYAEADNGRDAAQALSAASFAAYAQGAMDRAETHATRAITICRYVPEAHFQLAKVQMSIGNVDGGLGHLRNAIGMDRLYVVKAWSDPDFTRHEAALVAFTDQLRDEKAAIMKAKALTLADVSTKIMNEAREVLMTLPDLIGGRRTSSLSAVQTLEAQIAVFQAAKTVAPQPRGLLDTFSAGDALEVERGRLKDNISKAILAIGNSVTQEPLVAEKLARRYMAPKRSLPMYSSINVRPIDPDPVHWHWFWDDLWEPISLLLSLVASIGGMIAGVYYLIVSTFDGRIGEGLLGAITIFFVSWFSFLWIDSIMKKLKKAHRRSLEQKRFNEDQKRLDKDQKRLDDARVAAENQDLATEKAFNDDREAFLTQLSQLHSVLHNLLNSIREHAKRAGAVAICVGIDFGAISSMTRLPVHAARSMV